MTRAAISGVGVVSAFGVGARAFFDGLAGGRAAVGPIRRFDVTTFPVRVAGEVPDLPAVSMDAIRDRKIALGLAAAREAWQDAGCTDADRGAALIAAVGLEQALLEDFAPLIDGGRNDWPRAPAAGLPAVAFRAPIDAALRALAEGLALTGPRVAHVSACAAGALAVAHAAALIERGEHDVVVAGATDSMINPLGLGGMARLGAPSPRHAPDACRPFDRRRDGLAMGEGAAFFVVEDERRARARGARVQAVVAGWGSTQDGWRVTAPRPDGAAAARAISKALARAGLPAEAIGYVNAHGTGTPLNDPAEVRALRLALGAHADRVPVSSIKGAVGHLMAASGAVELAACLLPLARGPMPGTAHHREPDPDCDVDVIGEAPRAGAVELALSNSFGFGGQNAAVLLARGEP
jgi:3-oxoacyl-(acyl-carrier-protein) synthase